MSMDGFRGSVKIEKIQICAGKGNARPCDNASMKMDGFIVEYDDERFRRLSSGDLRKQTSVSVRIDSYPIPDFSEHVPNELSKKCIGEMVVTKRSEKVKRNKFDIHAQINLVLDYNTFDKLIAFKDSVIFVEPIFFREEGKKEKKIEVDTHGEIISFIERIYFSPDIENK